MKLLNLTLLLIFFYPKVFATSSGQDFKLIEDFYEKPNKTEENEVDGWLLLPSSYNSKKKETKQSEEIPRATSCIVKNPTQSLAMTCLSGSPALKLRIILLSLFLCHPPVKEINLHSDTSKLALRSYILHFFITFYQPDPYQEARSIITRDF